MKATRRRLTTVRNPPPVAELPDRFWRWFGTSVVVTPDGSPRVVYHGTRSPRDFVAFATGSMHDEELDEDDSLVIEGSRDPNSYLGPHFTEDRAIASHFALGKAASWDRQRILREENASAWGRVLPVYLCIERPMVFDSDEALLAWIIEHGQSNEIEDDIEAHGDWDPSDEDGSPQPGSDEHAEGVLESLERLKGYDPYDGGGSPYETAAEQLGWSARRAITDAGYDGVKYRNDVEGGGWSWIAAVPGRVKSALVICPAYDRNNDSIME